MQVVQKKKHNKKFEFIDHSQITTDYLWNEGIYLQDTGKSPPGQNFMNTVRKLSCGNNSFSLILLIFPINIFINRLAENQSYVRDFLSIREKSAN